MFSQLQQITLLFVSYKSQISFILVVFLTFLYELNSIDAQLVTVPPYSRYGANYQTTCNREPTTVNAPQTKGNNGFKIKLSGNPEKYVPGEMYTGMHYFLYYFILNCFLHLNSLSNNYSVKFL